MSRLDLGRGLPLHCGPSLPRRRGLQPYSGSLSQRVFGSGYAAWADGSMLPFVAPSPSWPLGLVPLLRCWQYTCLVELGGEGGDYWARAFQGLEVHLIVQSFDGFFAFLFFHVFVSRALGGNMENGPTAQYNR